MTVTAPSVPIIEAIAPSYARMDSSQAAALFCPRAEQTAGYFASRGQHRQRRIAYHEIVGRIDKPLTNHLRDELLRDAADAEVDEGVLYMSSPGGISSGVADLAEIVARFAKVKRLTVFAEDILASAALWIASGASEIVIDSTCEVGSIGVYTILADASRMFEKAGIDVMIIRSGPHKGTGEYGPKITAEEIEQVQLKVDSLHRLFVAAVARGRKLSVQRVNDLATGRTFRGTEAVAAGLADRVGLFEDVLGEIVARNAAPRDLTDAEVANVLAMMDQQERDKQRSDYERSRRIRRELGMHVG
jgi:signal peptide peptidase SppA